MLMLMIAFGTDVLANATCSSVNMYYLFGKKRLYWFGSFLSILPLAVIWAKPTAAVMVLMSMMGAFGFVANEDQSQTV